MRGVNLNLFDFDYDLTWAGFFLSANEQMYGRYGGRDASSADGQMSLAGLRHAMAAALATHRRISNIGPASPPTAVQTVEQYPAAQRRQADACIHCHHVYDFRREALQTAAKWRLDELWVYPFPENVGLTLDVDEGDRVKSVADNSPAAAAGLRAGDCLQAVNGVPTASLADVQYGLQRSPAQGIIPITWMRAGKMLASNLDVPSGWRKTDISWRWSLRGLEPSSWVHGDDLTSEEKKKLGLGERQLAFFQGNFLSIPARQAGIRQNDVIIGLDGKKLEMTAQQFQAFVKLNYKLGDHVTYNLLRAGMRLDVSLTLIGRPP